MKQSTRLPGLNTVDGQSLSLAYVVISRSLWLHVPAMSSTILLSTKSSQSKKKLQDLLTLAQELVSDLDKKHQHDLIIFNFSNTFDRVPHERLLRKLDHYGIRGSTHNWIRAFLTDRTQQVLVGGAASETGCLSCIDWFKNIKWKL